jgi:hypothetical protein
MIRNLALSLGQKAETISHCVVCGRKINPENKSHSVCSKECRESLNSQATTINEEYGNYEL